MTAVVDITPFVSANGIGNVAKANGVATKDAMDYIKSLCPDAALVPASWAR